MSSRQPLLGRSARRLIVQAVVLSVVLLLSVLSPIAVVGGLVSPLGIYFGIKMLRHMGWRAIGTLTLVASVVSAVYFVLVLFQVTSSLSFVLHIVESMWRDFVRSL